MEDVAELPLVVVRDQVVEVPVVVGAVLRHLGLVRARRLVVNVEQVLVLWKKMEVVSVPRVEKDSTKFCE